MATRQDDEGGSRLWRGMRALIFGDDGETTLRDEIEDAIDEAEDSRPVAGDLSQAERKGQDVDLIRVALLDGGAQNVEIRDADARLAIREDEHVGDAL